MGAGDGGSVLAAGAANNSAHYLLSSYYVPSLTNFISFDPYNILGGNFQSSSFYRK